MTAEDAGPFSVAGVSQGMVYHDPDGVFDDAQHRFDAHHRSAQFDRDDSRCEDRREGWRMGQVA